MKQATGNLWTYPADVICITTNPVIKANGAVVMGRGCAREARDRFPGIDKRLGDLVKLHGNRPMKLMKYETQQRSVWIVSFPTKHNWRDQSDLELIQQSAMNLQAMAIKFNWQRVVMPRPGCGNGGLDWNVVRPVIEPLLDDTFTIITHPERNPSDQVLRRHRQPEHA